MRPGPDRAPNRSTMSLRIRKLAGLHHYVRDLEWCRRFYVDALGFSEVGKSSAKLEQAGRQRSLVFRAGEVVVTCSSPLGEGGRAARYLSRHPEGIGAVAFEVDDVRQAFAALEARGATPVCDVQRCEDDHGSIETFSITTPLSDTNFRFVQRRGYRGLFPGMETYDIAHAPQHELGFGHVDHVTANFRTMKPALLWLEHVLGFEPFWDVEFHTQELGQVQGGSGLRSQVMWDASSGIKLANNEPLRPSFRSSQIDVFCDDNRGDGIQHVALGVRDIVHTVRQLRARGVELMSAPPGYYQKLPERLAALGISALAQDLGELQELGILVDGSGPRAYLLQIFLKDAASQRRDPQAGPFFYEIIQRQGDAGFGEGNFRALFDSVEGQQLVRTA
jgi:4-hydroxyphenylpyruvate dioxygenase